jgi:hypothetical protein
VISGVVIDPVNPGTQPSDGALELITRDYSGRHTRIVAEDRLHPADHGVFTFQISANRSNHYIVKFLGGSGLSPADSAPLHFAVESVIPIKADRNEVHHGHTFTIAAKILPAVDREGAWMAQEPGNASVAMGRTDSHGYVTLHVPAPSKPGSYDYGVACGVTGGDDQTEGVSKTIHITVT